MTSKIYSEVTDRIIAQLERGVAPWIKPWDGAGCAGGDLPYNADAKREYSGVNILLLWATGSAMGYDHPGWVTYKQAKRAGGHVRKGERGTVITYVGQSFARDDDDDDGELFRSYRFLKYYRVFNVDQCDGLPDKLTARPDPLPEPERLANCERVIADAGATIRHGGDRACYSPSADYITLPIPQAFKTMGDYYAAAFHEHGHWTGHKSRLARDMSTRFTDHGLAAEELTAELTAAFMSAALGIPGKLQHAEYIGSWIRLMKDHKTAIFTAAKQATLAANYIRHGGDQSRQEAA